MLSFKIYSKHTYSPSSRRHINQLIKKQWHHENEIKQLKDRLRREVSKNKHHSSNNGTTATNGTSITEINPVVSTSSSTISVGKNCQLISVNLASTASSSTSYSSSSASEAAERPSYSGTKSKHSGDTKYTSSKKSNIKSSKEKSSTRYDQLYNEFDVADRPIYINQLKDKRVDSNMPSDGTILYLLTDESMQLFIKFL